MIYIHLPVDRCRLAFRPEVLNIAPTTGLEVRFAERTLSSEQIFEIGFEINIDTAIERDSPFPKLTAVVRLL